MSQFIKLLSTEAKPIAPGQDIPEQKPDDATTLPDMDREVREATEDFELLFNQVMFAESLENHKLNPLALIDLGRRQSYLSSTVSSMEAVSEENISVSIESIITSASEKLKEWIAKAIVTVKKSVIAVKAKLGFAAHNVDTVGDQASSKLAEESSLTKTIKAHPYATVAACLAACTALVAIVPMFTTAIPTTMSAEAGAVGVGRLASAVKAIKWPFGSFSLNATKTSISVAYTSVKNVFTAMRTAPIKTIKDLGWTQSLIKGVQSQAARFARVFPKLSELMVAQFKKEVDYVSGIASQPGLFKKVKRVAGSAFRISMYLPFLSMGWSVVTAVFGLIKDIVLGTFRIIKHTFNALAGKGTKVSEDDAVGEGELA